MEVSLRPGSMRVSTMPCSCRWMTGRASGGAPGSPSAISILRTAAPLQMIRTMAQSRRLVLVSITVKQGPTGHRCRNAAL